MSEQANAGPARGAQVWNDLMKEALNGKITVINLFDVRPRGERLCAADEIAIHTPIIDPKTPLIATNLIRGKVRPPAEGTFYFDWNMRSLKEKDE